LNVCGKGKGKVEEREEARKRKRGEEREGYVSLISSVEEEEWSTYFMDCLKRNTGSQNFKVI
jgi:hypothetical protein